MQRIILAALLAALANTCGASLAADDTQTWRFRVFLDDKELGHHRFDVRATPAGSDVDIRADFEFKLMFITAFLYEHETSESWQGSCLEKVRSTTLQNRKRFAVAADRAGEALSVRANVGGDVSDAVLPDCVMSFAYWNPDILTESQLLNVQTGEYMDVNTRFMGRDSVDLRGATVDASRFQLRAKDLEIDLWYSDSDEWIALESTLPGGRKLRYIRV